MDPLSIAAGAGGMISVIQDIGVLLHKREKGFTSVWNTEEPRRCFLKVIQSPSNDVDAKCLIRTTSEAEVSSSLQALSPIPDGTTRVYVEEFAKDIGLSAHLQNLLEFRSSELGYESRFKEGVTVAENLRALSSQRKSPSTWLRTEHFHIPESRTVSSFNVFDQQNPLRGVIKTMMAARAFCLDRQRTISNRNLWSVIDTLLTQKVWISANSGIVGRRTTEKTQDQDEVIIMLDKCSDFLSGIYCRFKSRKDIDLDQKTWIQLLVIQYLHFHLMQVDVFLTQVNTNYAMRKHKQLDPRKVSLTQSILTETAVGTFFGEDMRYLSLATTELVSYAVDIVSESMEDINSTHHAFRAMRAEIRAESMALANLATRMVEQNQSRLKFFQLFWDVQDSVSIKLLTLLACIFLPLSLASSILSMQTRFAKLHFLLYDFCGVVTIIGSLTVLVLLALKLTNTLSDLIGKSRVRGGVLARLMDRAGPAATGLVGILTVNSWALIFTSFMVGMIKDVTLGLKILGYGFAAFLGGIVLGCGILLFLLAVL
ncbi:MAG: hypothetical protein M1822_008777 [Bathelium mastoideum]|nr:MAG: hypothetical protein M1822_008777 [Bathelium mastoideum]